MKFKAFNQFVILLSFLMTSSLLHSQSWNNSSSDTWTNQKVSIGTTPQANTSRAVNLATSTERYGLYISNNTLSPITGLDDGGLGCFPDAGATYGLYATAKYAGSYAAWFDGLTGVCGDFVLKNKTTNVNWLLQNGGSSGRLTFRKKNGGNTNFTLNGSPTASNAFVTISLDNEAYKAIDVEGKFQVEGDGLITSTKGLKLVTGNSANYPIKIIPEGVGDTGEDSYNFSVSKTGSVRAKGVVKSDFGIEVVDANNETQFKVANDGYLTAREVKVTLSPIPDYVFEPDYPLLPLNEFARYLKEHKHLPNIPSAKEIEENGIGLGDLQVRELEKIEELALYILQLNERLEKLEKENAILKEAISK